MRISILAITIFVFGTFSMARPVPSPAPEEVPICKPGEPQFFLDGDKRSCKLPPGVGGGKPKPEDCKGNSIFDGNACKDCEDGKEPSDDRKSCVKKCGPEQELKDGECKDKPEAKFCKPGEPKFLLEGGKTSCETPPN